MNLGDNDFKEFGVPYIKQDLLDAFNTYLPLFKINTPNRLTAFFMNCIHESAGFVIQKEIRPPKGKYVKGLYDYYGRGIGQITWYRNYLAFQTWLTINLGDTTDIVNNPDILLTPKYSVLSAIWFFTSNKLYIYADKGDFNSVAGVWNTGRPSGKVNHMDRRDFYKLKIQKWILSLSTP